jgi:hypothetical protein
LNQNFPGCRRYRKTSNFFAAQRLCLIISIQLLEKMDNGKMGEKRKGMFGSLNKT